MITLELLKAICPKTKEDRLTPFIPALTQACEYYEISASPQRLAAFLAQIAHESGGFNFTKENLNYSAQGLQGVFKKYFPTEELANEYARQPERIANRVYASRMGNGDEESGDGWKFRGRGLIQLTGKNNYSRFAEALGIGLDELVDYLETPEGAVASAAWFWDTNGLNAFADSGDFVTLTKRINGGTIGLEDRKHHYELALEILGA